jgi:ubiquinone/menaquinone biosynthesis C-methylase UbiE
MDVKNKNDFDKVAPYYNFLSRVIFGNTLIEAQTYFLNRIPDYGTILILGGGDGIFLERLIKVRPNVDVVYIEKSEKMLLLAKRKVISKRIVWMNASWTDLPMDKTYDVVITNFFFDLFTEDESKEIIRKVSQQVRKDSIWLVSDFIQPQRWWDNVILLIMFKFFKFVSNMDVQSLSDWNACFKGLYCKEESKLFRNNFILSVVFKINGQEHIAPDT